LALGQHVALDQPHERLVDQVGRPEGVAGPLPPKGCHGQAVQLVVQQAIQPVAGPGVAAVDFVEESRHRAGEVVGHPSRLSQTSR
jgi:hypothetical protein